MEVATIRMLVNGFLISAAPILAKRSRITVRNYCCCCSEALSESRPCMEASSIINSDSSFKGTRMNP